MTVEDRERRRQEPSDWVVLAPRALVLYALLVCAYLMFGLALIVFVTAGPQNWSYAVGNAEAAAGFTVAYFVCRWLERH